MDDAEVVGNTGDHWIVVSHDRRYFLESSQFDSTEAPYIGQKGWLGYVQRPASRVLLFTDDRERF